jgi:hypothetical protein
MSIWSILPINDLKEHEADGCHCGPRVEMCDNGDMMIIHNAYDKRELVEELLNETDIDKLNKWKIRN